MGTYLSCCSFLSLTLATVSCCCLLADSSSRLSCRSSSFPALASSTFLSICPWARLPPCAPPHLQQPLVLRPGSRSLLHLPVLLLHRRLPAERVLLPELSALRLHLRFRPLLLLHLRHPQLQDLLLSHLLLLGGLQLPLPPLPGEVPWPPLTSPWPLAGGPGAPAPSSSPGSHPSPEPRPAEPPPAPSSSAAPPPPSPSPPPPLAAAAPAVLSRKNQSLSAGRLTRWSFALCHSSSFFLRNLSSSFSALSCSCISSFTLTFLSLAFLSSSLAASSSLASDPTPSHLLLTPASLSFLSLSLSRCACTSSSCCCSWFLEKWPGPLTTCTPCRTC